MRLHSLLPTLALTYSILVVAQDCVNVALSTIPSCARHCILHGATSIGCQGTDFGCQCAASAALFAAIEDCVSTACPSGDYQAVIDGTSALCDCASPLVVARQLGTASVSGIGTVVSAASNTAIFTATAAIGATTGTAATATAASTSSGGGTVTAGGSTSTLGSGNTWTGYTSVSNVATASVVGAAAQATPAADMFRFVVPFAIVGAAML
ncbi:hypothetical protein VPNG_09619 [Cytospora leucostoma]|uniref:CFEM domain-containing protein n=1 Tax=Cytospora leucostoma TaxID=1230097 RepID=A0A423VR04_9PEZI|nr:hypothetical protein VPNG_09619 [Cytospora leucostoma]